MSTTFTVSFPDGSQLPITVTSATHEHPPANALRPHTVTFGTSPGSQFVLTLTPGKTVPPAPPAGPPALTLPAGFEPTANYTTPVAPAWQPQGGFNDGNQATMYEPAQVTGDYTLTAQPGGALGYLSGWIQTEQPFKAGCRIDFDVTLPEGQGLWPACWLVATGQGEIDVMECLGGNPAVIYATLHSTTGVGWTQQGARRLGGSNVFTLVWEPGRVTIAVDYQAYAQFTAAEFTAHTSAPWPFDTAELPAIVSLAVGGPNEWGGPPNPSTVFPAALNVNSVKTWA